MPATVPTERDGQILRALSPSSRLSAVCAQGSAAEGFAWVGGQTPHDPTSGRLVRSFDDLPSGAKGRMPADMVISDIPSERARAQAWRAIHNIGLTLAALGSSLDRLVHVRVFLREMRNLAAVIGVLEDTLKDRLPTTTVIGGLDCGADEEIAVAMDAVATTVDSGINPEHLTLPPVESLTTPFPTMTRAGPLLFTSPVNGVDVETGELVRRLNQLTLEECRLADGAYYRLRDEQAVAEHIAMWRHIRTVLDAAIVPFENILRTNGWLRMSMQEFAAVTRVRRKLFGTGAARTAATSLPVAALRREDALFESSVIACMPQGEKSKRAAGFHKQIKLASHGVGPYYVGAVQAGPFVFAAGEVPVDTTGRAPRVVSRAADLEDGIRLLQYGRPHAEVPTMAQAHHVYCLIGEALSAHGGDFSNVVHQTVYLSDLSTYPALERIATLHFGVRLPPTSLVSIQGASPFPEVLLEIEVTAAMPVS